ncbi:MAG: glycosyltransferase family 10 [Catalinimonas sp.]
MTRYYLFGSNYSPFSEPHLEHELRKLEYLKGSALKCDLVVTRNLKTAKVAAVLFPGKKILVWTHEPRYDGTSKKRVNYIGRTIHIFNVFTGDVFWHNGHFFNRYHYNEAIDLGITTETLRPAEEVVSKKQFEERKMLIGMFTRKETEQFDYIVAGQNTDLNQKRQELAWAGYKSGDSDIVGRNWGSGIALEASGHDGVEDTPWWTRKIELLNRYRFSIAIENTLWPCYVTEKIWQSICAYSLPIYHGRGSSIYNDFPESSFIDSSVHQSPQETINVIRNTSYEEWTYRLNACIEVYNQFARQRRTEGALGLTETMDRITRRLHL